MANPEEHYRFRDELVERLRADLLGPTGARQDSTELLDDWPVTTYATGVLFPRPADRETDEEDIDERDHDETESGFDRDEVVDTGIDLANVRRPSATGITFAVDPARSRTVRIVPSAAVYDPVNAAGEPTEPRRAERRTTASQDLRWRRRQLVLDAPTVDATAGARDIRHPLADGLELRVRVRPPSGPRGTVSVTATLVNTHVRHRTEPQDTHCFFQVGLRVETPDGSPALVERPVSGGLDDEVRLNRLLYRHAPSFATGHGCAADWEWQPPAVGTDTARSAPVGVPAVWTEHVPTYAVLLTDSAPPGIDTQHLSMSALADASPEHVVEALRSLTDGYGDWIAAREQEAATLRGGPYGDTEYLRLAGEQLELCRRARRRMDAGIRLLQRDEQAMRAFRLANKVMAEQFGRGRWMAEGREGLPTPQGTWRPFQLGFLLLCLEGTIDARHEDREIVDLLWFPTGGGKTEAYLGLIAFTVLHRRLLHGDDGGGVTVLMRYTLRLLTLQQFERAARLICALESLRSAVPEQLGQEPVSVGMWVGRAATPNTLAETKAALKRLRSGEQLSEQNPRQLRNCPWCGTPLGIDCYVVEPDESAMRIVCPDRACLFRDGLPVHVVDTEIYRVRPTLVIATVDKFARIAWRDDVAALFNRDSGAREVPPPQLVVQDELHLISGPLGTLTGLYEAAIDVAAGRPKVVASTATIRRAHQQGRSLFDRRVAQFPPTGLDARDSWFAVEAPPGRKASRRYVGLLAPGLSQATLLIRAYASLLHNAQAIRADDTVRDAYWTLIGYFNSLRLLGAAELQVQADVNERLKLLAERAGDEAPRQVHPQELTSRVPSSEIPQRLDDLSRTYGTGEAADVVLATNMISVGVDVDRLGLMAVTGQPQTTAEYIQATSRVGRTHPGLVVTLFNAARSRDLSHYEDFVSYHSSLYQHVESTSVTPFSARARDRALHAVFVGLARLMVPAARSNSSAARVSAFEHELETLRETLVERVRSLADGADDRDPNVDAKSTDRQLGEFIQHWKKLAQQNSGLVYEPPFVPGPHPDRDPCTSLLRNHVDLDLEEALPTLWSLRDVDVETPLYLES
ncbi:DNA helicase [Streptomyces albus]|uniref:helicase-related protein n=1 Tax=Streptomyces albus TaxID=1888 RepID=UPI0013B492F1|nr:helicase-related protein [Streptomyces albus]QID37067.1 DNA helicase [Streptomyces albus]